MHRWKALDETKVTTMRMTNNYQNERLCEKATCPPDDSYGKETTTWRKIVFKIILGIRNVGCIEHVCWNMHSDCVT